MRKSLQKALLVAILAVPAAARSDEAAKVKIDNFTFGPDKITIAKGGSVTWTNQDDIPHSIVLGGIGVHSKALDTDQSFTYRFEKTGTFAYMCGLHPQMHGEVIVR